MTVNKTIICRRLLVLVASEDAAFRDKIGVNPLVSDMLFLKGFGLDTHCMHHRSRRMTPHMQGVLMVSAWWIL